MNVGIAVQQPDDPELIAKELSALPDGGLQMGHALAAAGRKQPLDVGPVDTALHGERARMFILAMPFAVGTRSVQVRSQNIQVHP